MRRSAPVAASQMRAVLSPDPVTTRAPSADSATLVTHFVWPLSTRSSAPVAASQIRAVLSHDPVTTRAPSADSATLQTIPVWPLSTRSSVPVAASQIRAVLSADPVTMRAPSADSATLVTAPVWPAKIFRSRISAIARSSAETAPIHSGRGSRNGSGLFGKAWIAASNPSVGSLSRSVNCFEASLRYFDWLSNASFVVSLAAASEIWARSSDANACSRCNNANPARPIANSAAAKLPPTHHLCRRVAACRLANSRSITSCAGAGALAGRRSFQRSASASSPRESSRPEARLFASQTAARSCQRVACLSHA